jgi:hypothetical protein
MSRGYDGYEMDDSRGSGFSSGRDVDRGSSSSVDPQMGIEAAHEKEKEVDWLDRRGDRERPPLFPSAVAVPTLTATKLTHCGIPIFMHSRKWGSFASSLLRTLRSLPTTGTAPRWRAISKISVARTCATDHSFRQAA